MVARKAYECWRKTERQRSRQVPEAPLGLRLKLTLFLSPPCILASPLYLYEGDNDKCELSNDLLRLMLLTEYFEGYSGMLLQSQIRAVLELGNLLLRSRSWNQCICDLTTRPGLSISGLCRHGR
ncbi:hypothetical protein C8T65DRAFT_84545 [Cerioporus squamosus]|nr:hypothetical protein C8T65DRAFT_84545 [Cerioporus squamosus]